MYEVRSSEYAGVDLEDEGIDRVDGVDAEEIAPVIRAMDDALAVLQGRLQSSERGEVGHERLMLGDRVGDLRGEQDEIAVHRHLGERLPPCTTVAERSRSPIVSVERSASVASSRPHRGPIVDQELIAERVDRLLPQQAPSRAAMS